MTCTQILACLKGQDCLLDQTALKLRYSKVELRLRVPLIQINSCAEVLNSILMVSHVLVYQSTLYENRLVLLQQLLHLSELLQGFLELLCTAEHETEMEHGRDVRAAVLERILVEDYGVLYFLVFELSVWVRR